MSAQARGVRSTTRRISPTRLLAAIAYEREIKANDAAYRRVATNIVKRDFGLTKVKKPLDDADTDAFWALVERAAGRAGAVLKHCRHREIVATEDLLRPSGIHHPPWI